MKPPPEGAGFDTSLTDGLRIAIRDVIGECQRAGRAAARHDRSRAQPVAGRLRTSTGTSCRDRRTTTSSINGREQRVARLGDPGNPRSWYGRSRARVATGISLTAPGIPMLFMGQEFLEDKQWSDNFEFHQNLLLHWAGLEPATSRCSIICASRAS